MNIYALPGYKVKANKFLKGGYESEEELAQQFLKPEEIYTVKQTRVSKSISYVYLEEFAHLENEPVFNTVFFEDVVEQSLEDTKKHPDYIRYHSRSLDS